MSRKHDACAGGCVPGPSIRDTPEEAYYDALIFGRGMYRVGSDLVELEIDGDVLKATEWLAPRAKP